MKRLELIEQLEVIQRNIETVQEQLALKMPIYYTAFGKVSKWEHLLEIREKALKYWKRRFNRVVLQLGYYL